MREEAPTRIRELAAELIELRGWVQGRLGDHYHGFCMVGALQEVGIMQVYPRNSTTAACAEIRKELNVLYLNEWNDAPGRTQEQVLAALRGQAHVHRFVRIESQPGRHCRDCGEVEA